MREIIVNAFINDKQHTVYQTTTSELFRMYDKLVASIKSGENFNHFLNFEGAISSDGKIKFDRESTYTENDKRQTIVKVRVVFKYPVYQYFYQKYRDGMSAIKEKEKEQPISEPPVI